MTTRTRVRWLLERLTAFLLCFCVAAAFHLWQLLQPGYAPADASGGGSSPLNRPVAHLHFDDAPIEQVLNDISRQTGQKIVVDWDELRDDWGEFPRVDTTVHLDNVTLSRALFETFRHCAFSRWRIHVAPPNEVWVYAYGGPLSTASSAHPVVRDYDASDLLQPFSPAQDFIEQGLFGGPGTIASSERQRALDDLVDLIRHEIWPGTATFNTWANRLVVVAPAEDQERVDAVLESLRATLNAHRDDPKYPGGPR
jgi:hypothetical protein